MRKAAWILAVLLLLTGITAVIMLSVSLSDSTVMTKALSSPKAVMLNSEGSESQLANVAVVIAIAAMAAGGAVATRQRGKV